MLRQLPVWILALAIGALSSAGCSFGEVYLTDPLLREVALTEQQKHYSAVIRWSAFNKAARYVQEEHREAFLKAAPPLKQFRFTDYESEPVSIDEAYLDLSKKYHTPGLRWVLVSDSIWVSVAL